MIELLDSGCGQHPPRNFTLRDNIAGLVYQLVTNLPVKGNWSTYICEYGHTHSLKVQPGGGPARTRLAMRRPVGGNGVRAFLAR
jgi:hypothetical protein